MPDLAEERAYHPAMSFSAGDTVVTSLSRRVSYLSDRRNSPLEVIGYQCFSYVLSFDTLRCLTKQGKTQYFSGSANGSIKVRINIQGVSDAN
jgi:hypothetical protein